MTAVLVPERVLVVASWVIRWDEAWKLLQYEPARSWLVPNLFVHTFVTVFGGALTVFNTTLVLVTVLSKEKHHTSKVIRQKHSSGHSKERMPAIHTWSLSDPMRFPITEEGPRV